MSLEKITALSVKYGSDARFVLAGGGNLGGGVIHSLHSGITH